MSDTLASADGGVPERARPRRKRWTNARMAAFLRELAETGSVRAAAESVGMGRQSAYKLRRRLAGSLFDTAWERASRAGRRRAVFERIERASGGGG
jgi:molybdenum-dependent DNA-binding transcriptional regulator ModE